MVDIRKTWFVRRWEHEDHIDCERERRKELGVAPPAPASGKTTVAVNLAFSLANRGLRVSLLDADLMAPNAHLFLGDIDKERIREAGRRLTPFKVTDRIEFLGMGVFAPRGRGVALNYEKAMDFITTMVKFVNWTGDVFIVDCPPGALDINIRLMKEFRGKAGAVVVGEPHLFALEDNLRMIDLLQFHDIEVKAVVLNKFGAFNDRVARAAVAEYERLGYRVVKIPWNPELQYRVVPELFDELAEVVVA